MNWRWSAWQVLGGTVGLETAACYDWLEQSQWWPAASLRANQQARLEETLHFASHQIPAYRALGSLSSLRDYPVLSRRKLMQEGVRLQQAQAEGPLFSASSSGSTGEPVTVSFDGRSSAWRNAAALRADTWGSGQDPTCCQAGLWGNSRDLQQHSAFRNWLAWFYRNTYIFDCFVLDAAAVRKLHAQLLRLRPAIIFGYVSALTAFVRISQELGLKAPVLHKVIPTAEQCSAEEQAELASYFGCPVLGRYGSREIGPMAHQCEAGHWHLHSELFVAEVLQADGSISASGSGSLLCTTLTNRAMPLIRYEIGDVLDLSPVECACGRGLPTFSSIDGRVAEHILCRDGRWISSLAYTNFLRQTPFPKFRLIQDAPDHLLLQLESEEPLQPLMRLTLLAEFEAVHGPGLTVDVETLPEIAPLASGKSPHVVNLLHRDGRLANAG